MSHIFEKVSDYDQEIPKSQTADPPRHREEEPQDIYRNKTSKKQNPQCNTCKQSNKLSLLRQDDCKTRKDMSVMQTKTKTNTEPSQTMGGS